MPVTVSHAKSNIVVDFAAGLVTVGNSSGGTTTMQATDLVRPSDWNSAHQATLQLTGSEIASLFSYDAAFNTVTNASGVTVRLAEENFYEPFPFPLTASTSHTPGIGTWYFDPFVVHNNFSSGRIITPVTCASWLLNAAAFSMSTSSHAASVSKTGAFWHNIALYTDNTGGANTSIGTYWTAQLSTGVTQLITCNSTGASLSVGITNAATIQIPGQWDTAGNVVYSTITTSGTLSVAATSLASSSIDSLLNAVNTYLSGSRMDIFGFNTSIAPGNYIIAHQFNSSTGTTTGPLVTGGLNYAAGTIGATQVRSPMVLEHNFGAYKQVGKSSSNTLSQVYPWHGYCTTSQSTAYSTIGSGDLRATNVRMYFNIQKQTAG